MRTPHVPNLLSRLRRRPAVKLSEGPRGSKARSEGPRVRRDVTGSWMRVSESVRETKAGRLISRCQRSMACSEGKSTTRRAGKSTAKGFPSRLTHPARQMATPASGPVSLHSNSPVFACDGQPIAPSRQALSSCITLLRRPRYTTRATMVARKTALVMVVPQPSPPRSGIFASRSPIEAPSGRVRI